MKSKFDDVYPLTPMQRGMLFHTLYAPQSGVYVGQMSCTLLGDLDEPAFLRAWQEVVDANAILRSAFIWKRANEPQQVVAASAALPITQIDLSALPAEDRSRRVAAIVEEDRATPFNLARPPLMRMTTVRLGPREVYLIWTRHHLIYDGWSNAILLRQVMTAYARHAVGLELPEPECPPFAQYVRWLQRQSAVDAERVWRAELAGFTRPVRLECDRGREGARGDGTFTHIKGRLPATTMDCVRAFAASGGLTTNTCFQAAWAALLARYSGSRDIVFGATSSGRSAPIPGIDRMIGVFINTLPVRTEIPESGLVTDWLQRHQAQQVRLRQYEHTPLTDIRRWADVPPGEPLFESILVYENFPPAEDLFGAGALPSKLDIEIVPDVSSLRIDYPLTLVVEPQNGDITLAYDERRFDRATIEGLMAAVDEVLLAMARPGALVGDLLRASGSERAAQLRTWNATDRELGDDTVLAAIDRHAAETPGLVAVSAPDTQLTQGALRALSDRLARALVARGVPPGANVGVALERSPAMIVTFLAVLKAGCAFVPIDPSYPQERLAFIASDARLRFSITSRRNASAMGGLAMEALRYEDLASEVPSAVALPAVALDQPAYAIYTSGSTGRPKAVVLTHRGLLNTSSALAATFGISSRSTVLQFASVGFDGCVGDVFSALFAGAKLCLATPESATSASAFAQLLRRERVTHVTMPPSFARLVPAERLEALEVVACVGEACPAEVVDRWQPGRRLVNGYGPTELSIAATLQETRAGQGAPPIGLPIQNARAYVLDDEQEPAPLGVSGELHLGGAGIALGYLGQPALTALRFVPDAVGDAPGGRLYRTGDLVRRAWTGVLEYVGRSDDQVKIRGFRVELGEIEARLVALPFVEEGAVAVRSTPDGDRSLTAYLVPRPGAPAGFLGDARATLAATMPQYMVPSSFVSVSGLPRNTSGKIDRQALAALQERGEEAGDHPPAAGPSDEVQRDVTAIWCRVLRRSSIGADDDFFKLAGGDSLSAVRMIAEIEKKFGRELPVATLFKHPTIAQLAEVLRRGSVQQSAEGGRTVELDPTIRRPSAPTPAELDAPGDVLLTGATGFLGAFLLEALLRKTTATVHCVVRATDRVDARRRVIDALGRYGLSSASDAARIEAIPGDLASPLLGVGPEVFAQLAERVGAVYHAGAHVNYLFPYERLEAANVLGTAEVLRFAAAGRPKVVHHVSTLGVFPPSQRTGRVVTEADLPDAPSETAMGYARSKWAAEILVREASTRNIPAVIYRPADISGHSESGASNASDFLCLTLQTCLRVNLVPSENSELPIAPVDYVADAIVELSLRPGAIGNAYHLNNPAMLRLPQLTGFLRAIGYPVESVPTERWLEKLREAAGDDADGSLRRIITLFGGDQGPDAAGAEPASEQRRWDCDCSETQRALAGSVVCPLPDETLIRTYIRALVASGYLPPA